MTQLFIVGVTVAGGGLLALFLLWRFQEHIVFQPPRVPLPVPGHPLQVTYRAADGQPLTGYLINESALPLPNGLTPVAPNRLTVLVFHGNAELAAWLLPWARELSRRTAVQVFVAEYRGYAGLPGTPSYQGVQADALAAFSFLRDSLGVLPSRCVLFGHSLGSAVAAELAATVGPAALVLQAPFTSARAMGARLLIPSTPGTWRWFSRVHYDTAAVVQRLECPVFVAHGQRDRVVPIGMGQEVFGMARSKGALLVCPDAGHNDVPDLGGERYWSWMSSAMARASGAGAS